MLELERGRAHARQITARERALEPAVWVTSDRQVGHMFAARVGGAIRFTGVRQPTKVALDAPAFVAPLRFALLGGEHSPATAALLGTGAASTGTRKHSAAGLLVREVGRELPPLRPRQAPGDERTHAPAEAFEIRAPEDRIPDVDDVVAVDGE